MKKKKKNLSKSQCAFDVAKAALPHRQKAKNAIQVWIRTRAAYKLRVNMTRFTVKPTHIYIHVKSVGANGILAWVPQSESKWNACALIKL